VKIKAARINAWFRESIQHINDVPVFDAFLVAIMVELRMLLAEGENCEFGALSLYCDWFVHEELERRPAVDQLRNLLVTISRNGSSALINDEINQAIGLHALRKEIQLILKKNDIQIDLDQHWWEMFYARTLRLLEGRPLVKKIEHDFIKKYFNSDEKVTVVFRFVEKDSAPHWNVELVELKFVVQGPIGFDPREFDK